MMGLRKFFVLPAALTLALIGSGTALGQLCQVQRGTAKTVRVEGLSEPTSDILVVCTPGIIEAASNVKITVTLSDGAFITNEVVGANNNLVNTIYATQYITTTEWNERNDVGGNTPDQNSAKTKLIAGGNAVEMVIDAWDATADATHTLRLKINGIHFNAADVGVGNTVTATVQLSNIQFFGNDTATLARPVVGLKSSRVGFMEDNDGTRGNGASVNEPVQGLTCAASKMIDDDMLDDDEDVTIARIEVKEGFATAFTKVPGGENDDNVRIRLSFNDIPDGVDAYLRPMPDCSFNAGGSGHARGGDEGSYTYTSDAAGTAGAAGQYLELTLQTGLNSSGVGASEAAEADDDGYVKVNLSSGSGTAVYDITADGGGAVDNCKIPIAFVWTSGVDRGSAGTVSVSFAPLSTVAKAATSSTPWPRFDASSSGSAMQVIMFEDCSTTLLFPFVTNQAGYETGIAISNTSQDSFGTTENAGECTINYYGSMMGGGAAPDAVTSNSVEAGGQLVFLLSAGNSAMGVSGAPGFQGYLMVRCSFQFAHGLAFMTNGAGGAPTLAQSYLALVVPARQGDRGVGSSGFEMLSN